MTKMYSMISCLVDKVLILPFLLYLIVTDHFFDNLIPLGSHIQEKTT